MKKDITAFLCLGLISASLKSNCYNSVVLLCAAVPSTGCAYSFLFRCTDIPPSVHLPAGSPGAVDRLRYYPQCRTEHSRTCSWGTQAGVSLGTRLRGICQTTGHERSPSRIQIVFKVAEQICTPPTMHLGEPSNVSSSYLVPSKTAQHWVTHSQWPCVTAEPLKCSQCDSETEFL